MKTSSSPSWKDPGERSGIDAPRGVKITRTEVLAAIGAENRVAVSTTAVAEDSLVAALGALGGSGAGERAQQR